MSSEPQKHIIAASNILWGTGYFLIFPLPEGWAITRSYLQPDVHSTIRREEINWVEAGQTDQIFFNSHKRIALDLMIRVKRGRHEGLDLKGLQVFSQGQETVFGHTASYCMGEVKQGLFKKTSAKTLRICFYCSELRRTLFLHFTGKCQESDLKEIYESLADLECH